MDPRLFIIDITEKLCLVATAGFVTVLFPPLRNRLLGLRGRAMDRVAVFLLGFCLSLWGATMGKDWFGIHINLQSIGVMMAALLGGWQLGLLVGLASGVFYALRIDDTLGLFGICYTIFLGTTLGAWAQSPARWSAGWPAILLALSLEFSRFVAWSVTHQLGGLPPLDWGESWPAMLVQVTSVAGGVGLFVVTTRVVLSREESAIALIEARATADQLALQALRRKLEPHFLFNALNTLRATIRVDPARAREMVADLSDVYRYFLTHPEDATLQDEVDHALAYLAIERARLGEQRLQVDTRIAPEAKNLRIPALLLQPLVENAVKHGVAAHEGAGRVEIHAAIEGAALCVRVIDQVQGEPLGAIEPGTGIALETLRARLQQRYEGQATLTLRPYAEGMEALIRLPLSAG